MNSISHILSENVLVVVILLVAIGFILFMQFQPEFGAERASTSRVKALRARPERVERLGHS